jgi:folate-dependent phosphoribosylglycinamide formyltransferase PurN
VREFASVNSADSIAWLASEKPDVVVVNGTRIISTKVLEACNAIFLNTHCGITPGYRGVHGGYWALYSGEPENMGVTVHIVNKGIDTGDIVYQQVTSVDAKDNFLTYPVKQYIAGIPLMLQAINDIRAGRLRTIVREDLRSALWHHPTLWQYLSRRFMRGIR